MSTLLLVDDEHANRDALSRRLVRQGYEVTSAASGKEALEVLQQQNFDLVLLDVMMPEMDGLEVLSAIRESRPMTELPVIMVTARNQSADVVAALQLGANDYVTKPVNFTLLLARLQTVLRLRNERRDAPVAE